MPPKGKSTKSKKGYKSKPKMNKSKSLIPRVGVSTVYNFTRYASATVGSANVFTLNNLLSQNSFNFNFSLSSLRNSTDFTNLFDQYRIDKVDLYFRLVNNPDAQTSTTVASSYFPTLWYVKDVDDVTSMTVADMQEKQGVKRVIMNPQTLVKISVVPKFQKMVYQTLTNTGYGPASGWLDCIDTNVPHYALKTVFNVPATGVDWNVEVQAKYHCSFKGAQ